MTNSSSSLDSRFESPTLACLDRTRIPKHIAFIPDGNRRWAKKRLASTQEGHREGADNLMNTVKAAMDLGVSELTFYAFSTENWSRPTEEIEALMALYIHYLSSKCTEMIQAGIKLEVIGDIEKLPAALLETIKRTRAATQDCTKIKLIMACNYGARDELCRAVRNIAKDLQNGNLSLQDISEATISNYLDTRHFSDPELLIRTSGEMRISNFLLWQMSYTEIHISSVLWPDFSPQHLLEAIIDFQSRDRRWGGAA